MQCHPMSGNTKLFLDQLMLFTKSNSYNELLPKLENWKFNEDEEFHKFLLGNVNINAAIESLQTYTDAPADHLLCGILVKHKHVQKFCEPQCRHVSNNCVSPEYINIALQSKSLFPAFFNQQPELVKRHCVSCITLDGIQRADMIALQSIKEYLKFANIQSVIYQLLMKLLGFISIEMRQNLCQKILFFISIIDPYGELIDVFQLFFGILPTLEVRQLRAADEGVWIPVYDEAKCLDSKNYKTILEIAKEHLRPDLNVEDKQIIESLHHKIQTICQFRKLVYNCLQVNILPDLGVLIFRYIFPKKFSI